MAGEFSGCLSVCKLVCCFDFLNFFCLDILRASSEGCTMFASTVCALGVLFLLAFLECVWATALWAGSIICALFGYVAELVAIKATWRLGYVFVDFVCHRTNVYFCREVLIKGDY